MKAFDLSQKFLSEHKAQSVAQVVGPRLVQQKKANAAAELYLKIDLVKECVDAFISAEEWGKAKKVAEQLEPNLVPYVEECYKQSLHKSGDINAVADYDAIAALDIYANNGQWEECIRLAEKQVSYIFFGLRCKFFFFFFISEQWKCIAQILGSLRGNSDSEGSHRHMCRAVQEIRRAGYSAELQLVL